MHVQGAFAVAHRQRIKLRIVRSQRVHPLTLAWQRRRLDAGVIERTLEEQRVPLIDAIELQPGE